MVLVACIYVSLLSVAAATDGVIETPRLIVRDKAGILSGNRLEELAQEADRTVVDILQIWSAKAGVRKHGKIRLELDRPLKSARTSVFYWSKDSGRRVRTVWVFGVDGRPQQLAHKLTHAVFPNPDKLIRNMMGIYSENRIGNRNSFPMCGFSNDTWVQALLQLGAIVPLDSLGPEHADWGMEFRGDQPVVRDRARQHAAYAEAGSFGEYLIRTHGIKNMKKFYRLSLKKERPWKEAFGLSLEALETNWIHYLKSRGEVETQDVLVLKRLIKENPDTACDNARSLASDREF
jgi:hypothetical protein